MVRSWMAVANFAYGASYYMISIVEWKGKEKETEEKSSLLDETIEERRDARWEVGEYFL